MRGLGLLFVMVMVNSKNAAVLHSANPAGFHSEIVAGLPNSAGEGTQSYNHEHNKQGSFSSTNV